MGRINASDYINTDSRIPFDVYNLKSSPQVMEKKYRMHSLT